MKKTKVVKKQPKSKSGNSNVQKLGLVLGALESKIAPGTQARPITCHAWYCE